MIARSFCIIFIFFTSILLSSCSSSGASNQPPSVEAGVGFEIDEFEVVSWGASASDPDGSITSIEWTQVSGPSVELLDRNTINPKFVAPETTVRLIIGLKLTATDNEGATADDLITITIRPVNQGPEITMKDSISIVQYSDVEIQPEIEDIDGEIVNISWEQLSYPQIEVDDYNAAILRFLAPSSEIESLTFKVTAEDNEGAYAEKEIIIQVIEAPTGKLRAGFPLQVDRYVPSSSTTKGPSFFVVDDFTNDGFLNIMIRQDSATSIYAWDHNGNILDGWPALNQPLNEYLVTGDFDITNPGRELAALGWTPTNYDGRIDVYRKDASLIDHLQIDTPMGTGQNFIPVSGDLDNDGQDEIILQSNKGVYIYNNGLLDFELLEMSGIEHYQHSYPMTYLADITGDDIKEIIVMTTGFDFISGFDYEYLAVFDNKGGMLDGFPIQIEQNAGVVFADIDNDKINDLILTYMKPEQFDKGVIHVINPDATDKFKLDLPARPVSWPTAADINFDGSPELIVLTDGGDSNPMRKVEVQLDVFTFTGERLPGWPVFLYKAEKYEVNHDRNNKSANPVVGDVTGDSIPEIVVQTYHNASLLIFNRVGNKLFHQGLGLGSYIDHSRYSPAIVDSNNDGINEVITALSLWSGENRLYPAVWSYEFTNKTTKGPVLWEQERGGAQHLATAISIEPSSGDNVLVEEIPNETTMYETKKLNKMVSFSSDTSSGLVPEIAINEKEVSIGNVRLADNSVTFDIYPKNGFFGQSKIRVFATNSQDAGDFNSKSFTLNVEENRAPIGVADEFVISHVDNYSTYLDVLANDTDPEGKLDEESIQLETEPELGEASIVGGLLRFYKPENTNGITSFTYSVADKSGLRSELITVRVELNSN